MQLTKSVLTYKGYYQTFAVIAVGAGDLVLLRIDGSLVPSD
jgi:hypothetical protein